VHLSRFFDALQLRIFPSSILDIANVRFNKFQHEAMEDVQYGFPDGYWTECGLHRFSDMDWNEFEQLRDYFNGFWGVQKRFERVLQAQNQLFVRAEPF